MANLYGNLANVYEAMYHSFINYKEEFAFYSNQLKKYKCQSLLEVGCGTGNLAKNFIADNFYYTGLDISSEMLAIAKENNASAIFINGDMRNFTLLHPVDAGIITGRTISYLLSNQDVTNTFTAIHKNLNPNSILCFDCIDARLFIPTINPLKKIVHTAVYKNKKYQRDTFWKPNTNQGFLFDWASTYFEEGSNNNLIKLGDDNATLRTFTKEEMTLFLQQSGFAVQEIINRPSYAFDTFVIIAKKIN